MILLKIRGEKVFLQVPTISMRKHLPTAKHLTIVVNHCIDKCSVIKRRDFPVRDLNQGQPMHAVRPALRTPANRRNALGGSRTSRTKPNEAKRSQ
jgi:hypothetical protein